jgi:hypothetical protein
MRHHVTPTLMMLAAVRNDSCRYPAKEERIDLNEARERSHDGRTNTRPVPGFVDDHEARHEFSDAAAGENLEQDIVNERNPEDEQKRPGR